MNIDEVILANDYEIARKSFKKGLRLVKLKSNEQAVKCLNKVFQIKPDSYQALTNRGVALHRLGRYREAVRSYDQAFTHLPEKHFTSTSLVICKNRWYALTCIRGLRAFKNRLKRSIGVAKYK